jgi:hypothetical protein
MPTAGPGAPTPSSRTRRTSCPSAACCSTTTAT